MKARTMMWLTALAVIATLALPAQAVAQQHRDRDARFPYILIDLGTLGGPSAYFNVPGTTISRTGVVAGGADTSAITPFPQECTDSDCHVQHAFAWRRGIITDLGALPGGYSSGLFEVNDQGDGVGFSDVGVLDPLSGSPEFHGAVWQHGQIIDLGTLGGTESWASAINDRGQVAGFATNAIPDPYVQAFCFACATQSRAVLWQDGVLHDLGTLGGPDSAAYLLNERGQVAGSSYTNGTPNPTTGLPTADPFLWEKGTMRDLGTLGGTFGLPTWMNSRGEVVGQSNLNGDLAFHPFLWDGRTLIDLGTVGGDFGLATWLNEAGAVTGWATTAGNSAAHAFLWRHGVMTDLGAAPGDTCSFPEALNEREQVVGHSGACGTPESAYRGALWEHGAVYRLDALVAPSALSVLDGIYINDLGEIVGEAVLPNGDQHAVLLVPAQLAAREGLTSNAPAPGTVGTVAPATAPRPSATVCETALRWRVRLARGYHLPCFEE